MYDFAKLVKLNVSDGSIAAFFFFEGAQLLR
jgi:hypothetical protein